MDIEQQIRKLARSSYWLNIYRAAKEIGSINLFNNNKNFSGLQSVFLHWLEVYNSLYTDLAQKEWKYLSEDVINDNIRCDAFLFWRGKMREQEILQYRQDEKVRNLKLKNKDNVQTFDVDLYEGGN